MSNRIGMGIDDFLKHSNRGSKKKFLKGWKGSEPYAITVWLHTQASILAVWRHGWYRVHVDDNKGAGPVKREVWMDRLVCYEDEEVLQKQRFRDRDTGARQEPPRTCPHCKMIEYFRDEVDMGRLSPVAPVFQFTDDDPKKTRIIHAAGIWGGFGDKNMPEKWKPLMAGLPGAQGGPITPKTAWAENSMAKMEYCFTIVDNDNPAEGVQLTIEPNLLGDKVKDVIAKTMKSLGGEQGNPLLYPYAIRFEYNPKDGIEFNKKYDALRLEMLKPTPAILRLIRETEAPDIKTVADRFNLQTHRALLERYCLVKGVPWDSFFEDALKANKGTPQAAEPNFPAHQSETRVSPPVQSPPQVVATAQPADELFGCDGCGGAMKASDTKCPHCGMTYDVQAAEPPPPAKPLPKRSEARATAAHAPTPAATPAANRAAAQLGIALEEPEACGGETDDIPFGCDSVLDWCQSGILSERWNRR